MKSCDIAKSTPFFMESQFIHIVGPGGAPYELGQPMLMFAGPLFLGRVDPVELSNCGAAVHFGSFASTSVAREEPRNVGALLFYEACAHVVRFHPQVELIGFSLSRPMPGVGDADLQAATRVAALERIGASNIEVTPAPSGLSVVTGSWACSERNHHQLKLALEEQRAIYRELGIGRGHDWPSWLRWLERML
jgi:hypothetical protein